MTNIHAQPVSMYPINRLYPKINQNPNTRNPNRKLLFSCKSFDLGKNSADSGRNTGRNTDRKPDLDFDFDFDLDLDSGVEA